jgi:hypothetical protein
MISSVWGRLEEGVAGYCTRLSMAIVDVIPDTPKLLNVIGSEVKPACIWWL